MTETVKTFIERIDWLEGRFADEHASWPMSRDLMLALRDELLWRDLPIGKAVGRPSVSKKKIRKAVQAALDRFASDGGE